MNHFMKMAADYGPASDEPGGTLWELRQKLLVSYRQDMKDALRKGRLVKAYRIKRKINRLIYKPHEQ